MEDKTGRKFSEILRWDQGFLYFHVFSKFFTLNTCSLYNLNFIYLFLN